MREQRSPAYIASVDLEEYFHVEAFSDVVSRDQWDSYSSRVEGSTRLLLDLLDQTEATATFFVLGWVAQRQAPLLREISRRGHEIACHSFWHRLVFSLTPKEFKEDTLLAKETIEQATGQQVVGYRAPSFSITRRSLWAIDVLGECGFRYDSSIFPIHHDTYGIPDAPRGPFLAGQPALTMLPMTTFRWIGPQNWPVGGGAYLRLLPWWYTRMGVRKASREGLPIITYIHPWELDPDQPRIRCRTRSRLRHYTNLRRTVGRLRRLLGLSRFSSVRDSGLQNLKPSESSGSLTPVPSPG